MIRVSHRGEGIADADTAAFGTFTSRDVKVPIQL
jgi:hypothetical protein